MVHLITPAIHRISQLFPWALSLLAVIVYRHRHPLERTLERWNTANICGRFYCSARFSFG